MKTTQRLIYICTALLAITFTSCEYYYTDELFKGFWQVKSIEHRNTGETTLPEGKAYYAFQRHMIQLSYIGPDKVEGYEPVCYLSYFIHEGDSLHTGPFRIYHEDEVIVPLSELKKFGIYTQETVFKVEETTKRQMTLTSDSAIITLRQY